MTLIDRIPPYDFALALRRILGQVADKSIDDEGDFTLFMLTALNQSAADIWLRARQEPSYSGSKAMPPSVKSALADQKKYVKGFAKAVIAAATEQDPVKAAQAQAAIARRAAMWVASIQSIADEARAVVAPSELVKWIYGDTVHCKTCLRLHGQVHTRAWYKQRNYWPARPGNTATDCGGWQCRCRFVPVGARTKSAGRLLRVVAKSLMRGAA